MTAMCLDSCQPWYFSVLFVSTFFVGSRFDRGEIAQLVEQWPEEPRVLGSSPSLATMRV